MAGTIEQAGKARYLRKSMRRSGLRVVVMMLALSTGSTASIAGAQDDWSVTREPRRRSRPRQPGSSGRLRGPRTPRTPGTPSAAASRDDVLLARYRDLAEADPTNPFAVRRYLELRRARDGNLEMLARELDAALVADASAARLMVLRSAVHESQGDLGQALSLLSRASSTAPADMSIASTLAALAKRAGDAALSQSTWERVYAQTSTGTLREDAARALGELALDRNDVDAARPYFADVGAQGERSLFLSAELARALEARGRFRDAATEYARVAARVRGDARAWLPLARDEARMLLRADALDEAAVRIDAALARAADGGFRGEFEDMRVEIARTRGELETFVQTLSSRAHSARDWARVGQIEDELGHDTLAISAYRRALASNGRDLDLRLRLVAVLGRSGALAEVESEYRTLARLSPRDARFSVDLATFLVQSGRRDEALRIIDEASRRAQLDVTTLRTLAAWLGRWNETARAERLTARVAQLSPNDTSALIALGSQQLQAGDQNAAFATWRRVIEAEPDRVRGHALLARIYLDHDRLPDAITEYEQVLAAQPDDYEAQRGVATAYESLQQVGAAINAWLRLVDNANAPSETVREARQHLISIWRRNRELDQRVRTWERDLAANPPVFAAGQWLVEAYARTSPPRTADLAVVLARLTEIDPTNIDLLRRLESVRSELGDRAGAMAVLQALVERDARTAPTYLGRLAEHALALYRDEDAVAYLQRAVSLNPDDAQTHRRLAALYRARHQDALALAACERALALDPRDESTRLMFAELLMSQGRASAAIELYLDIARTSPDDALVERVAQRAIELGAASDNLALVHRLMLPWVLGATTRALPRHLMLVFLRTAAKSQGEPSEQALAFAERSVKPLVESLADPDPTFRDEAISLMLALHPHRALDALLAFAQSDAPAATRAQAFNAAMNSAQLSDLSRILPFARHAEVALREPCVLALARLGKEPSRALTETLIALAQSPDANVRSIALMGLARRPEPRMRALFESHLRDALASARWISLWALGRIGAVESATVMIEAARERPEDMPFAIAAISGWQFAGRDDLIAPFLFSANVTVRRAAGAALIRAHEAQAEPQWPLTTYDVAQLRRALLARALEAPASHALADDTRSAIARAFASQVQREERIALAALTQIGSAELAESLQLDTAEQRALFVAVSQTSKPELLRFAADAPRAARVAALNMLAAVPDADARARIVASLADADSGVRVAALDAVDAQDAAAFDAVARQARVRDDWPVRLAAARALGRLSLPSADALLIEMLAHESYAVVRLATVQALAARPMTAQVRDALQRAAQDAEPSVARAVANALISGSRS